MNELINQQREQIAQLTAERDALLAQNHVLITSAKFILDVKLPSSKRKAYAALADAVNKTPQQHLAEIRANAVRDFVYWGTVTLDPEFAEFKDCAETFASLGCPNQYADSIRQEKK